MTDLMHWHGRPSEPRLPPECCVEAAEKAVGKAVDESEAAERRRIVLEVLESMERYRSVAKLLFGALESVVDPAVMQVVDKVVTGCADLVRQAGCICPMVEIGTFGDPDRQTRGYDSRCGVHGAREDVTS